LKEAMPLTMTFHKIGNAIFIDPVTEEEEASESRLSMAISFIKKDAYINALQKGGSIPFSVEETNHILDNAVKINKKLQDNFLEKLKKAEKSAK
jgi:exosome complex RNA-binding protein Rrp42 (RNase PH superfamily)